MRDAVAAAASTSLVHCPDRLARHYAYQVLLIEEFRRAGVEIVFLNGSVSRRKTIYCFRSRAWWLSTNGPRSLNAAGAANATPRSGHGQRALGAPYGYRYVGKRDAGGVARYEVLEDEAPSYARISDGSAGARQHRRGCRRLQQGAD